MLLIAVISATAFYGQSIDTLKMKAENGNAQAQLELGKAYYEGKIITADTTLAIQWFKQSAEQGNAKVQLELGICYKEQAFKWIKKSAEQENADAQFELAGCSLMVLAQMAIRKRGGTGWKRPRRTDTRMRK